MAAAIVDLNINEGETFLMTAEFWEDEDNTIPIDTSTWVWEGIFRFGDKLVPMEVETSAFADNVMKATVDYNLMSEISTQGDYDIEALIGTEKFRQFQGNVTVSQEVV